MITLPRPLWSSMVTFRPSSRCSVSFIFAHIGIDHRLRLGRLRGAFGVEDVLDHGFRLANRKRKCDDLLRDLFQIGVVLQRQQGARVAEGQLARFDLRLQTGRQLQQAHEIRDRNAVLAGARRDLLLGHVELGGEALEGAGLVHGIQVFALQVFDDGDLHRLLVRDLAQNGGNGGLLRQSAKRASAARRR